MPALSSDPVITMPFSSSQSSGETIPSSQPEPVTTEEGNEKSVDEAEVLRQKTQDDHAVEMAKVASELVADEEVPSLPPMLKRQSSSGLSFASSFSTPENAVTTFSPTPGYLANRWNSINSSFSIPISSQQAIFETPPV